MYEYLKSACNALIETDIFKSEGGFGKKFARIAEERKDFVL